jgi:hypothetical protein
VRAIWLRKPRILSNHLSSSSSGLSYVPILEDNSFRIALVLIQLSLVIILIATLLVLTTQPAQASTSKEGGLYLHAAF